MSQGGLTDTPFVRNAAALGTHRPARTATSRRSLRTLVASWVRRPRTPMALFRLVLALGAAAPLGLSGLLLLTAAGPSPAARLAGGIGLLAVGWWWLRGYRGGSFPEAGLALEGAAIAALAVGVGGPNRILWLFYAAVYFRAIYGPGPVRLLTSCTYSAAFLAAVALTSPQGAVGIGEPWALLQVLGLLAPAGIMHAFSVGLDRMDRATAREREVLEERLRHQALHDPLTGLANRALLASHLETALARARRHSRRLAVLLVDLDGFKFLNDRVGHSQGDRVLMVVADRLRLQIRPTDTVARLGGDEFALLLEEIDEAESAVTVARRLRRALEEPMEVEGRELQVRASVGIAVSEAGREPVDELLRNADVAMYAAKTRGKGRHEVFRSDTHGSVLDELELEGQLRKGLERGEYVLHYQPVLDLEAGGIEGLEALIRWNHPTRGLLSPAQFIPLAERTGFVVPLGRWAMREACRQAGEWQSSGHPPLSVAVNVSAVQLQRPDLVAEVTAALDDSGLDPELLTIEVTESTLLTDPGASAVALGVLKELGVRIAIDDFGTGYSSISYLRQLPIDVLKLDREYVIKIDQGPEDAALPKAVIKLAHTLGLDIVAEGIDRPEQALELAKLGCHYGQGFLFSRPLPWAEMEDRLDSMTLLDQGLREIAARPA
jgi:diguanylate cyclase (GGDEF)-like protein